MSDSENETEGNPQEPTQVGESLADDLEVLLGRQSGVHVTLKKKGKKIHIDKKKQ